MSFCRGVSKWLVAIATVWIVLLSGYACAQTSALPSWNDGPSKQAITSFVKQVTDKSGTTGNGFSISRSSVERFGG